MVKAILSWGNEDQDQLFPLHVVGGNVGPATFSCLWWNQDLGSEDINPGPPGELIIMSAFLALCWRVWMVQCWKRTVQRVTPSLMLDIVLSMPWNQAVPKHNLNTFSEEAFSAPWFILQEGLGSRFRDTDNVEHGKVSRKTDFENGPQD